MIRIEIARRKAGCGDDCTLRIEEDGRVFHNGSNWKYDLGKYMDPAYNGAGWLSLAFEAIGKQH